MNVIYVSGLSPDPPGQVGPVTIRLLEKTMIRKKIKTRQRETLSSVEKRLVVRCSRERRKSNKESTVEELFKKD